MNTKETKGLPDRISLAVIAIIIYAFGIYSYATLRFAGNWNENDTMVMTRSIATAQQHGSILRSEVPYGNGFTFHAATLFLQEISGVSLQTLQIYVYPSLAAFIPLIAYTAYRSLTGSSFIALLSTLMLYLQPDFLFVTWRGSHEKITWSLLFMLLFLISESFSKSFSRMSLVRYVLLFYIVGFAFVSASAFFASSFAASLAIAYIIGSVFLAIRVFRSGDSDEHIAIEIGRRVRRLLYISLALAVLLYLFFFYVYPPSLSLLLAFRTLLEGLGALFLNRTPEANPYGYVSATWTDAWLFPVLISSTLTILITASLVWLARAYKLLFSKDLTRPEINSLLILLFYAAFALQLVLSVIPDLTSAGSSNLQVRMLPQLMLAAIPLVALGVEALTKYIRRRPVYNLAFTGVAFIVAGTLSVMAAIKITNEPLLSNNWTFTTESERTAGNWVIKHSIHPAVWTGVDDRLHTAVVFENPYLSPRAFRAGVVPPDDARHYLVSDIEMLRWKRQRLPELYLIEENLIYDNGDVRIYHRRPRTIYQ